VPKRINKPVIPEPSPHFLFWSGLFGFVVLIAVIALDYANGWADEETTRLIAKLLRTDNIHSASMPSQARKPPGTNAIAAD
jgi:hypothetical protein